MGNYEQAAVTHPNELGKLLIQNAAPLCRAEAHYRLGCVYDRWDRYDLAMDELEHGLKLAGPGGHVMRA